MRTKSSFIPFPAAIVGILALTLFSPFNATSQTYQGGYFMDGYLYKYKMNPALTSDRNFVAIGNLSVSNRSDIGAASIFRVGPEGKLVPFNDKSIPDNEALAAFKDHNALRVGLNTSLINLGFRNKKNWFSAIDISTRNNVDVNLPYDLFRFLKESTPPENTVYDISGLNLMMKSYLSASYTLSIPIGEKIRVGATVKFLTGLGRGDIDISKLTLTPGTNKWTIDAEGSLQTSLPLAIPTKTTDSGEEKYDLKNTKFSMDAFGTSGFGGALDLGASYEIFDWLSISASVLDMGRFKWDKKNTATMSGSWDVATDSSGESEDLSEFVEFKKTEPAEKTSTETLPMTINAGIRCALPVYKKLSAGLLYTAQTGALPWHEYRMSLMLEPAHWFGISGSYSFSNIGNSAGMAMNLRLGPAALFLGAESMLAKMPKQLTFYGTSRFNATFGLNIVFGRHNGIYAGRKKKNRGE